MGLQRCVPWVSKVLPYPARVLPSCWEDLQAIMSDRESDKMLKVLQSAEINHSEKCCPGKTELYHRFYLNYYIRQRIKTY